MIRIQTLREARDRVEFTDVEAAEKDSEKTDMVTG